MDPDQRDSQVVKIRYTYAGTDSDTVAVTFTSTCPALTYTAITTLTYAYALTTGAATTQLFTGASYATTAVTAGTQCLLTFAVYEIPTTGTNVLVSTWATLDATGTLSVDTNTNGNKNLKIQMTYHTTAVTYSPQFNLAVACPVLTIGTPTATTSTAPPTVAAGSPVTIIAAATMFPANTCAVSAVSLIDQGTGTTLVGTFVTVSAIGLVEYDSDVLGNSLLKIQYTFDGSTLLSSAFTVTSACPALTLATLTTTYTDTIPNSAAGSNTQIIAGTDYVTNSNGASICAVTYALYLVPAVGSPTVATGTWLTIDAAGAVSVDPNTLGTGNYKVTYTHNGVAADSAVFSVTINCPLLT